jgi:hypothetical protein
MPKVPVPCASSSRVLPLSLLVTAGKGALAAWYRDAWHASHEPVVPRASTYAVHDPFRWASSRLAESTRAGRRRLV